MIGNLAANKLSGDAGNDRLYGAEGNDTLDGGSGNDFLDGGIGADSMIGGSGNDSYVVDDAGDTVIEWSSGGTDTVFAHIDYTLGNNVENLYLVAGAVNGTGNGADNLIVGNNADNVLIGLSGNDALYGGAGNDVLDGGWGDDLLDGGPGGDTMTGGDGNDIYYVDSVDDVIIEWDNGGLGGTDTVVSDIDYTLSVNLENLTLTGTADLSATGNASANLIVGNAGANRIWGGDGDDTINGGAGTDTLWGGTGNDTFVFRSGEANGDIVMDFDKGDKLVFEGFGANAFTTRSGNDLIIHDGAHSETITLYGSGAWAAVGSFAAVTPLAPDLAMHGNALIL
ncbi:MAG: calcium-binding protein [Sphingomonas bacterium]|nr:calcium-binding protein [Sphingomonas bacterium]